MVWPGPQLDLCEGGELWAQLRSGRDGGKMVGAPPSRACLTEVVGGETVRKVLASPGGAFHGALGALVFQVYDRTNPPIPALPGVHLDQVGAAFYAAPLLPGGLLVDLPVPLGVSGGVLRAQGFALGTGTQNGAYATTFAHDVFLR